MFKKFALLVLGILLGISVYGIVRSLPRRHAASPTYAEAVVKTVASTTDEITSSRTNAIVTAARQVSPAVVSINVTSTRLVTNPFWSFFDNDPFGFFRDFAPPRAYRQQTKASGSGLLISSDGYVVTNAHVAENASEISVVLPDGKQYEGELVDVSSTHDLALLKLKGSGFPYVKLGNSDDVIIGEWAIALGNPFGYLLEDTRPTVTVGVVSATNRSLRAGSSGEREYKNMIQTDAAINPGNSGGPLANANGDVIGINTFIFTRSGGSEGIGFAIPMNDVKKFVEAARKTAKEAENEPAPERIETKIGATVSDANRALKRRYRLASETGVVVVDVKSGSVAEAAGIEPGDLILSAGSKPISKAGEFKAAMANLGRTLDLVISREGNQMHVIYAGIGR
jgi:serine protease Do